MDLLEIQRRKQKIRQVVELVRQELKISLWEKRGVVSKFGSAAIWRKGNHPKITKK